MTAIAISGMSLTGVLRMTWVQDNLAHVLDHSQADETSGTWTGLACPGYGLALGADVDNAALRRLAADGDIADLVWEAPADLTAEHDHLVGAWVIGHDREVASRRTGSRVRLHPREAWPRTGSHRAQAARAGCRSRADCAWPRTRAVAGCRWQAAGGE